MNLLGRLGKDAEVKEINGKNVINFTVAVDTGYGDKKTTLWIDAAKWDAEKYRIVTEGSFEKFRQHPALGAFLLATGDQVLVEASPVDRIWGIGLAADDERAGNPLLWRGENLLGFALMEARDRLRG